MRHVNLGNQNDRSHAKQYQVPQDKVSTKHPQLRDLAEKLAAWLGDGMPAHGVPLARPEGDIRHVALELSSQGQRDDELVDEALDGCRCNHAEQRSREIKALQQHHNLEKHNEDNHRDAVCNCRKHRTEFLAAHAEQRAHAAGHTEHSSQAARIDGDGSHCHNQDTDERLRRLVRLCIDHARLSIDVKIGDESDCNKEKRANDLSREQVGEACTSCVPRHLSRGLPENLALVARDPSSRQSTVGNPRGRVGPGIASR